MATGRPVAFIYDRCATRSQGLLEQRLIGCQVYAARKEWVLRGRWLDLGDTALGTERPQLGELIDAMRAEAGRREVICLVHSWGRLAHDNSDRLAIQQRLAGAGGYAATTFDECARDVLVGVRL
ncbi:recombinase family protein [Streptomyces decoyicus]|uniref:recombinase family protein n=1 Tax=Streptomyces decoyicus TaxID=249567 RepID=UPI003868DEB7|nr:recombinase family protein [Streptomyces decoyicus]